MTKTNTKIPFLFIFTLVSLSIIMILVEATYIPKPTVIGTKTEQPIQDLPTNITIPSNRKFKFVLYGHGYQIYQCVVKNNWTLVTPDAYLINDKDTEEFKPHFFISHHAFIKEAINGGRATWESLVKGDNSKVTAKVIATNASPDNPKTNIPWLVTQVTATSGHGAFDDITNIIRVNTIGGVIPPVESCGTKYEDKSLYYSEYYTDYWYYH